MSARSHRPGPAVVLADADEAVERAAATLDRGELLGLPTETVYGLAADATNGEAVARIFAAKGRPRFNPLICHVDGVAMTERLVTLDPVARALMERFWPGALTLILPARGDSPVHPLAGGGLDTLAVRSPCGIAGAVIAALGRPVAAPSANPSGRVSATSAEAVIRGLGDSVSLVLDAGRSPGGVESTIVRPESGRLVLLRAGLLTRGQLEAASGLPVVEPDRAEGIEAPGQLASHYAPAGRVRLDVARVEPGEHLIAFGPEPPAGAQEAPAMRQLSRSGDLSEAAANLFAALAAFDDPAIERIAVQPIPLEGLGEAINDRLRRAAAPRD